MASQLTTGALGARYRREKSTFISYALFLVLCGYSCKVQCFIGFAFWQLFLLRFVGFTGFTFVFHRINC